MTLSEEILKTVDEAIDKARLLGIEEERARWVALINSRIAVYENPSPRTREQAEVLGVSSLTTFKYAVSVLQGILATRAAHP